MSELKGAEGRSTHTFRAAASLVKGVGNLEIRFHTLSRRISLRVLDRCLIERAADDDMAFTEKWGYFLTRVMEGEIVLKARKVRGAVNLGTAIHKGTGVNVFDDKY